VVCAEYQTRIMGMISKQKAFIFPCYIQPAPVPVAVRSKV